MTFIINFLLTIMPRLQANLVNVTLKMFFPVLVIFNFFSRNSWRQSRSHSQSSTVSSLSGTKVKHFEVLTFNNFECKNEFVANLLLKLLYWRKFSLPIFVNVKVYLWIIFLFILSISNNSLHELSCLTCCQRGIFVYNLCPFTL